MSDKYHSFLVVLEADIGEERASAVASAMMQLKGVLCVTAQVGDPASIMAAERAKRDLTKLLLEELRK